MPRLVRPRVRCLDWLDRGHEACLDWLDRGHEAAYSSNGSTLNSVANLTVRR
jgi:hypothetical protein